MSVFHLRLLFNETFDFLLSSANSFFLFFIFFTVSLNDSLVVESIIADANVVVVIGIMECKYLLTRYAPIYLID